VFFEKKEVNKTSMKHKIYLLLIFILPFIACETDRVKAAYSEKEETLKEAFRSKGLAWNVRIFFRVFKAEKELELWIWQGNNFKLFKKYPICSMSGDLGRKLKQGDKQVPEGIYHINRFNPKSNFHLSLGINYPNGADQIVADAEHPGGDIFIHGDCVSIGCMAMTDDKIKEIYLLANEAKKNGQTEILVHIYPFKMTNSNIEMYGKTYPQWLVFWQSLKGHYDFFEQHKMYVSDLTDDMGNYKFSD
jgi:murein L,D-transpeptidase YafK